MLADEDPDKLCQTVCMVQYFPLSMKQNLTDCPACVNQQAELGYEQYDNVHAMFEISINRSSLLPEVMRLRWFPTTSDPIFADAGIQVRLRSLDYTVQLSQDMYCSQTDSGAAQMVTWVCSIAVPCCNRAHHIEANTDSVYIC